MAGMQTACLHVPILASYEPVLHVLCVDGGEHCVTSGCGAACGGSACTCQRRAAPRKADMPYGIRRPQSKTGPWPLPTHTPPSPPKPQDISRARRDLESRGFRFPEHSVK